jgi:hypothetical protein
VVLEALSRLLVVAVALLPMPCDSGLRLLLLFLLLR